MFGLLAAPVLGVAASKSPRPTILAVVALFGVALLASRPLFAAYLQLSAGSMNYVHLNVGFALLGPGDLLNMAMVGVWLLHRLTRVGWRRPKHMGLLALYLILITASTVLGVDPGQGLRQLARDGTALIGLLALVDLLRTRGHLEVALWVVLGNGLAHSIMALFIFPFQTRLLGFPNQANQVALYAALGALVCLGLLLKYSGQRRVRLGLVAALGLTVITVLLTVSRTAYLSFALAAIWWVVRDRRGPIYLGIALLGMLGSLAMLDDQRDYIEDRLQMRDQSVRNRSITYVNAMVAVGNFPVFGVGYGQFTKMDEVMEVRAQKGRSAHSAYLGLPASAGLPAAVCVFLFLVLQGRLIWLGRRAAEAKGDAEATWLLATLQSMFIYRMASFVTSAFVQVHTYNLMGLLAIGGLIAQDVLDAPDPQPEADGPPDGAAEQLAG